MRTISRDTTSYLLLSVIGLLFITGLVMVYSATSPMLLERGDPSWKLLLRQIVAGGLGITLGYLAARVDYHFLHRLAWPAVALAVAMLVLTLSSGESVRGAARSISLGGFSFQTAEVAKLALLLFTAHLLARREIHGRTGSTVIQWTTVYLLTAFLIFRQPDFSTTAVITLIVVTQLFLGGLPWKALGAFLVAIGVAAPLMILLSGYRLERIQLFLQDMWTLDPQAYQLLHSLIALGRGGATGQGIGDSMQKLLYLPLPYNDFIFAVIGEELGLLGTGILIAAFGLLLYLGVRIIRRAPDTFGRLLAAGIAFAIIYYALLHMLIVVGLAPNTGLPLPFISYGGANLVILFVALGVLVNIHLQSGRERA
ncbi:cell division protein FtsW [bacterium]|nr:cell division protein FtsW [bacterium]